MAMRNYCGLCKPMASSDGGRHRELNCVDSGAGSEWDYLAAR
jgi:hypothetical protein